MFPQIRACKSSASGAAASSAARSSLSRATSQWTLLEGEKTRGQQCPRLAQRVAHSSGGSLAAFAQRDGALPVRPRRPCAVHRSSSNSACLEAIAHPLIARQCRPQRCFPVIVAPQRQQQAPITLFEIDPFGSRRNSTCGASPRACSK